MLRRSIHLVTIVVGGTLLALAFFGDASAQDTQRAKANELLVEAVDKSEQAKDAEAPGRKVELLDAAIRLMERIRSDYPGTDVAVKIATGQAIGDFDLKEVRERYRTAVGQACLDDPVPSCLEPLAELVGKTRERLARREAELAKAEVSDLEARVETLAKQRTLPDALEVLGEKRADLFRRLQEIFAEAGTDARVVDDGFVVQADVLFDRGAATLKDPAKERLGEIAEAMRVMADDMPDDVDWTLRVNGHADARPIDTERFPSNWEFSSARAVAVVKALADNGASAKRLAATAFGDQRPLEEGRHRANRRVVFELALTDGALGFYPQDAEDVIRGVLDQLQKSERDGSPDDGLNPGQKAAVRQQITACWSPPVGMSDADDLRIDIRLGLERDGRVRSAELMSRERMDESFYRAAAESAMRAVRICSPLKGLPPEAYSQWKTMRMVFDSSMAGGS